MDSYEKATAIASITVLVGMGGLGIGVYVEAIFDGIMFLLFSIGLAILWMWRAANGDWP